MELITNLVNENAQLAGILSALYLISLFNKALFTFLHDVVKIIPGDKDDKALDAVERSKAYQIIAYVLDWVTRVKLPK